MSEATDRPTGRAADDDAWARACAEDLAAEKERRRGGQQDRGAGTGSAAEELFKLFEAVAEKVSSLNTPLNNPLLGAAAQDAVRQFVNQAKSAAQPVVERNPEVFGHLAAAGSELLAAYRSAVEGHERRWTSDRPPTPRRSEPRADDGGDGPDDPGTGPAERIDLD
ncbi:DUF5304 domain-containing protein [Streptomyces sp. RerS4]|uniref:DUF5304 domain-containing protein n=1 Tax=Streptomyces sp. RerS4 TaxID=2942449 RepID=UPI00201C2E71|nr:DUF5304 domain-containing protein [Streptomyces sp. RerS4]UQX00793.1 DUF5304 domain-containing protein [Streptomyces sp. RerS4]